MVYFMENPIKVDDEQEYPYFRKPANGFREFKAIETDPCIWYELHDQMGPLDLDVTCQKMFARIFHSKDERPTQT